MSEGSETTKINWEILKRLALILFTNLRKEQPSWTFEDLKQRLNLCNTDLLINLAKQAGFSVETNPSIVEQNIILKAMVKGLSPEQIAKQTKIPLQKIMDFLEQDEIVYGATPYGFRSWGMSKTIGEPLSLKTRRISKKGQFSYGGKIYSLGSAYGNKCCRIEDAGDKLLLFVDDKPFALQK